jgi:hypothetical protein
MAAKDKPPSRLRVNASAVAPRLAVFAVVVVLVTGLVVGMIDDYALAEVAPYFILAIALQFLPFIVRPEPDPFEPAGLSSVHTILALVPAFTSFLAQGGVSIILLPHVSGRAKVELIQTVLIAYSLATLCYFAGYYIRAGKKLARIFPNVAGGEWERSRLILVSVVCFAFFIPAYAYFQARVGASITDITALRAGKAVWRDDATMSWLMRGVGLGFIPALLFVTLNFPRVRVARAIGTAFLLFAIGFLSTRLGQRGTAIFFVLNALIVVHYLGRRIPVVILAVCAFVLMTISNILGAYRANPDQFTASSSGPAVSFNATQTLVDHEDDRARLAAMAVVFHFFPERVDYALGGSWGPLLTAPIPRWLWPEKGTLFVWRDTNIVLELVGAPIPVPFMGVLYANFGWIGIVVGMALWGMFQRGLYEWLLEHEKDRSVVVLYSFIVVYFTPTMLQLSGTIGFVLPLWVALRFMRKKVKPAKKGALPPGAGPRPAGLLSMGPQAASNPRALAARRPAIAPARPVALLPARRTDADPDAGPAPAE